MSINPFGMRRQLCERHSNLKCNSSLLRQHCDRPATLYGFEHGLIDFTDLRRLSLEMRLQIISPAKMRLILVRKPPLTFRTFPKCPFRAPFHFSSFSLFPSV